MSDALILDCTYSMVHSWKVVHLYTCTAKVIFVGDPRNVSDVSHNHMNGKNNDDVQAVIIRTKEMTLMARDLYKFFPNLRSIDMYNSAVGEVHKEDFRNLTKLTEINLRGNQIKTLKSDLFSDNLNLEALNFISNPIKHVDHKVFDPLVKLTSLHFELVACFSQGFANNRANVELLIFRLFVNCPPSFEMTEQRILNGTQLKASTDTQVYNQIFPLAMEFREIKRRVEELERRLEQAEFDNKMLKALSRD